MVPVGVVVLLVALLVALCRTPSGADAGPALRSEARPDTATSQLTDPRADREKDTSSKEVDLVKWMAKRRQFSLGGIDYGFTGVPIVYFSPTTGWNVGMRIQLLDYRRLPYRYKMTFYSVRSSEGRVIVRYRLKVPRIAGTGFGMRLVASYKRDLRARFYGQGNDRQRNTDFITPGNPDFRDEFYYLYSLRNPRVIASVIRHIYGPVSMSLGFGLETADVDKRGSRALFREEGTPDGVVDGVTGFVGATLSWDSRDNDVMPTSGAFHEWSYETSRNSLVTGLYFKEIDFQRYTFTDMRYFAASDRITIAHRIVLEVLSGEVPLYAFGEVGGSRRSKGLGGSDSLRGFDRQRFTDNVRLFTNTEFRYLLKSTSVFRQFLDWYGVMFVDTGQVAPGRGDLAVGRSHWSSGLGVRVSWNADFVIRSDLGISSEQIRFGVKYRNLF
jgi:outer membrane protein assembly factor BamA